MYKSFLFFVFVFCCLAAQAQLPEAKRANIWYFGNGAGLDFSSGSPVAITNGALHAKEGCASICDVNGNLLFYTEGDTVWNRNHLPMPNGTGLLGCGNYNNSSVQGALIVPLPASNNIYYIFTNDCIENLNLGGFNYSIIDMSENFGLGDVISKNNFLFSPSSEMVSATKHKNGNDFWIITHEPNNNNFRVYLLTASGLTLSNIINVGPNYQAYGSIEISPNGKFIAVASDNILQKTILYEFNNEFGMIEYYTSLSTFGGERWTSFSPDGSKVFYTESGNMIYCYDLCYSDTIDIQNSYKLIDVSNSNSDYVSLQISNDLRLYIAGAYTDSISRISDPNNPLSIERNFLSLQGKFSSENLPNFPDYIFEQANSCNETLDIIELFIPNVFSPNADGINDFFSIKIAGYQKIKYIIYNRWGSLLKADEITLQIPDEQVINLWDATYKSKPVTDGVYFYVMQLTTFKGTQENKNGFIHFMR